MLSWAAAPGVDWSFGKGTPFDVCVIYLVCAVKGRGFCLLDY